MYRFNPTTAISASALCVSLVACGGSDPSDADYDDVATATANLLTDEGGELEGMEDAVDLASGTAITSFAPAGNGMYAGRRGQIDYRYEVTCRDEDGREQRLCSSETTDSASLSLSWEGTVDTPRRSASLARTGDWTLSGIQTNVVTFDGTGTYDVSSAFMALNRPLMRSMAFDYDASYEAVVFDRTLRHPTGGRIVYAVSGTRTASTAVAEGEGDFEVDVEVEFSGDGSAEMMIDGERRYRVILADGTVVREGTTRPAQ